MDVISPSRPQTRATLVPMMSGTVIGALLIVGGLALAYVAFATPFLGLALPSGRPDPIQIAIGITIWAVALVAPAGFVLAGANRLARNLASARGRAPRRSVALKQLESLPDDITVAQRAHAGRRTRRVRSRDRALRCGRDPRAAAGRRHANPGRQLAGPRGTRVDLVGEPAGAGDEGR